MKVSSTLLATAIGLVLASSAQAVHLDPNGRGQVLIYPYYTVNNGQQTLLSVTNTSAAAQVIDVSFHEAYNGRTVMNFRVFLSPFDMWTATVFNLRDAGRNSDGAAILTRDTSCTAPRFAESQTVLGDGTQYVSFVNFAYAATAADGGPTNIQRTREGWVEIIALADLAAPLSTAIAHGSNGQAPSGCADVRNLVAGAATTRPSGGLIGNASIINVAQGTILGTRPEALGGFTGRQLLSNLAVAFGGLATVNDGADSQVATAHVIDSAGRMQALTYGGNFGRPIDAVSAVLMADRVSNEFVVSPGLDAGSDWVLTMPTKRFYVDPVFAGSTVRAPFETLFDEYIDGRSYIHLTQALYDRNGTFANYDNSNCGFGLCPPTPFPPLPGYSVNVLAFSDSILTTTKVVGSARFDYAQPRYQGSNVFYPSGPPAPLYSDTGWMRLDLDAADSGHRLPASAEGKILRGLPVIGFWATNVVNNNVSAGVLANYSAAVRHATSVSCIKASDGSACD